MEILEDRKEWLQDYTSNCLSHYHATGEIDWKRYHYSKNSDFPSALPVKLSQAQIMLVTSSGAYLPDSQEPFDAANKLGDYQVRVFDPMTPFEKIDYAHEHYDQSYVRKDPQVLLPLRHLEILVTTNYIASLTPKVVSFMGYQPDVTKIIDITIPEVISVAQENEVDAVFLVPS
ncbi:glycine/sarcosine/betaine reductase selenoprotein B family protein [Candidatus Neomarinimicrobiota bacterium]